VVNTLQKLLKNILQTQIQK